MSIISALIILPFSFTANSALSATTTKTIQGTAPRLSDDLEAEIAAQAFNRFGFTYTTSQGVSKEYDESNINSFPLIVASTKVSALKSQLTSTFKDTLSGSDAIDTDGDGNFKLVGMNSSNAEIEATALSIKIRDGNNIDVADLAATKDKTFCELSRSNPGPYKIEISNNLRLTTEYGDPSYKDYTATTAETLLNQPSKQYAVNIAGICNLKPAEMTATWSYNSAKFDKDNGFKVDSGFPTTGFAGASFSLLGSGSNQNLYRCTSVNSGAEIVLSTTSGVGTNCTVTFNTSKTPIDYSKRPTNDITIVMQARSTESSGDWSNIDSYTVKAEQIKLWAQVLGNAKYKTDSDPTTNGVFPAANLCAGNNLGTITPAIAGSYFFARNELTNSLVANQPAVNQAVGGYFARDVDSTFTSEWGDLFAGYAGSGFEANNLVWTSDAFSTTEQFRVNVSVGFVQSRGPSSSSYLTVCKLQ